ncbi:hypothetical protein [Flavobacterium cerinum]|uniref:Uncharacterized protein n=1 Tax=Flavobacterium cerinum TaxID=2502784 RepID=A0A444GM17_9FLAO|nr:hypothetical protein [Flavobacterium cerinum]RWW92070.1 hypothetical protein EPI11_16840 [Flavobacterium cerinum]
MKFLYLLLLVPAALFAQTSESITWDDATINDKLSLTINKRDFEKVYKKADSIVTPDYENICGTDESSNFQYYYYKNLQYELDNGIMNFRQITFSKKTGLYFTYKGQRFDASTRLSDLKALFPNTVKETESGKNEPYKYILLGSSDQLDDSEWRFTFKNGYLKSIECFFPC